MKILILIALAFAPFAGRAQRMIPAGVYSWPAQNKGDLFKGEANDLAVLHFTAHTLEAGKSKTIIEVPSNEEQLLLIRSGTLTLHLADSMYSVGKGSIALILPGETYVVENKGAVPAQYYAMAYRAKAAAERGTSSGGSFVKDWNKLEFKPHARGGVRPYFDRPTAMSKRFEMHVTTLNAGLRSHDPHTHNAEEIVLILEGETEMQIGQDFYKAEEGDVVFVTSNIPHAIRNIGDAPCSYFAFQWEIRVNLFQIIVDHFDDVLNSAMDFQEGVRPLNGKQRSIPE